MTDTEPQGTPAATAVESSPLGAGFDFTDPNSPLAPFYLRTVHIVAIGFLGFIFVAASVFPLWHTDVWGHMRYGQWMVENQRIPDREPFCPWWDGRQPFTQFYTFTQLPMYWAYAFGGWLAGGDDVQRMAGGVEMLRLQHAILTLARFTLMLIVFLRASKSWPVSILGLVAIASLDLSNLAVFRPQTFAQVYFAALLIPLTRPMLSNRALIAIPLLLAFWANSHGSFVVAFALIGALAGGRALEAMFVQRTWPWRDGQTVRLALTLLTSIIAVGVLNPYGFELYSRTVHLSSHPSLQSAVGEWQPLAFIWGKGWHWVFMASLVVIMLTQLAASKPMPGGHLAVILLFGSCLALQNRFVIWWAMLVPWVLVPRWAEIAARWPARLTPTPSIPSFRKTGIAAAVVFTSFMWSSPSIWLVTGGPSPLDSSASVGTPWQLARQVSRPNDPDAVWLPEMDAILKQNYAGGKFSGTIMATPMQGDYLMWALAPDVPVTYAHIHLFHPDYWEELGIVGRGEPGWADVLEKYRVNLLVIEADYAPQLRDILKNSKEWVILLDESGDAAKKPEVLTRQLIAIRINPI